MGRILFIATLAVVLVCVVALLAQDDRGTTLRYGVVLVTSAYLVWLLFWAPCVEVSDGGIRLKNVWRTIELPWPAIERIDTRFALTLYTSYGRFVAWAAPASGRHRVITTSPSDLKNLPETSYSAGTVGLGDVPRSDSGDAAAVVRQRWEELRDSGHLDGARTDPELKPVHWHRSHLVTFSILAGLSVLALSLGR